MEKILLVLAATSFLSSEAFYESKLTKKLKTVRPQTIDELKEALIDNIPTKVIIDKEFDFTDVEGSTTVLGCYNVSSSTAECTTKGQLMLKKNNACKGQTLVKVTYSEAGSWPIVVGSNKVIQGEKGGALKGKGLLLPSSQNVEIRNLRITDINPHVIGAGNGIAIYTSKNVLIDGCFFKNIGTYMVFTGQRTSTELTISNSMFDGNTPYSTNCKGHHYWLWLFQGEGNKITLQNNVVTGTAGLGPKLVGSKNMLHMIQNTFDHVVDSGLLNVADNESSVVIEGNMFVDVSNIVYWNQGNVFLPQNAADAEACVPFLGRQCLLNTMVDSGCAQVNNSVQALRDFGAWQELLTKPLGMHIKERRHSYPSRSKGEHRPHSSRRYKDSD